MQFVQYNTGCTLEWDETLAPGDLIRTYYKGYWILTEIEYVPEPRDPRLAGTTFDNYIVEYSNEGLYPVCPRLHFVQVLREDGTPSKRRTASCSACYCSRVTKEIADEQRDHEVAKAEAKRVALQQFF